MGEWYYREDVKIERARAFDQFDISDVLYLHRKGKRPLDFDLHLALYILNKEGLPEELLAPIVQWSRENKMVVV